MDLYFVEEGLLLINPPTEQQPDGHYVGKEFVVTQAAKTGTKLGEWWKQIPSDMYRDSSIDVEWIDKEHLIIGWYAYGYPDGKSNVMNAIWVYLRWWSDCPPIPKPSKNQRLCTMVAQPSPFPPLKISEEFLQ